MSSSDLPAPALVLGLSPTGLAVVHALGPAGIPVFGADLKSWEIARYSKYLQFLPELSRRLVSGRALSALLEFASGFSKTPVVFTTSDYMIELLRPDYEELAEHFRFATPLTDLTYKIMTKSCFYRLCQQCDVDTPSTFFPKNRADVERIGRQLSYPAIIKPALIHKVKHLLKGKKVLEVHRSQELLSAYDLIAPHESDLIVQEIVPGPESNITIWVGYCDGSGRILDEFSGRKLRQFPPYFGSFSLCSSSPDETTARLSADFLLKLGFRGIASTEFKIDPRDGAHKMIEINPRVGLWHHVALRSRKNIPLTAYRHLMNEPSPSVAPQKPGVVCSYLARDLLTAATYIRKGELSLHAWLRSYRGLDIDSVFPLTFESRFLFFGFYYLARQLFSFARKVLFQ